MLLYHRNGFGVILLVVFGVASVACDSLSAQTSPDVELLTLDKEQALLAQVSYETPAGVQPAAFHDTPEASAERPAVTKEMIAKEQALVESTQDIPEDAKGKIKENLKKASEWIDAEAALKKRRAEIEAQLPTIPEELAKTRQSLDQFSDAEFQALPTGTSIAELEGQLASLRQQVEADAPCCALAKKRLRDVPNGSAHWPRKRSIWNNGLVT